MKRRWGFLVLLIFMLAAAQLPALVVKLGSIAPENSPWDRALKRLAAGWQQVSGGQVTVRVYAGGVTGSEVDMLRKMRINQLQAAALTGSGMGKINPDYLVFQLPFMAHNDQELQYLFDALRPKLEQLLADKGFKLLAFTKSGWTKFFSKTPIVTPDDLRGLKMFVLEGSPEIDQAWKEMGFQIVPLPANDALTALQSGMADCFAASPLTAAALQWFGVANQMTDMNWVPLTGAVVISMRAWQRIPRELQPRLLEASERAMAPLDGEVMATEEQALQVMKEHGLVVHEVPPAAVKQWEALADRGFSILIGKVISKDLYDEAQRLIADYRAGRK